MGIMTEIFLAAMFIAFSSLHLQLINGTWTKSNNHEIRVGRNARRQHNIPLVLDPGAAANENAMLTGEISRKLMSEELSTTNFVKAEPVSTTQNPTSGEISGKVMNEALSSTNLVNAETVSTTQIPSTNGETSRNVINEPLSTTNLVKAEPVSTTQNPSTNSSSRKPTQVEEVELNETEQNIKTTMSAKAGLKLPAEIQKITFSPNLTMPNDTIDEYRTSSIKRASKKEITEKPDLKSQNETKTMPLDQIKICFGVLSETKSCNYSVGKCENVTDWIGEIINSNNSKIFNISIRIKSLWSDLVSKNNACDESNNTDPLVQIILINEQEQSQTKERKYTIFYKDAKSHKGGDDDKLLCLPAGQCIQIWLATAEPSVSSFNIQITKYLEPDKFMLNWIIGVTLYALLCVIYIAIWINCPTVPVFPK